MSLALTLVFSSALLAKVLMFGPKRGVKVSTGDADSSALMSGGSSPERRALKAEAPAEETEPQAAQVPAEEKAEEDRMNINTASAEQLEELPGIGPALAGAVVSYRQENGPFEKTEDIMDVSGIGEAKYASIAQLITVGD